MPEAANRTELPVVIVGAGIVGATIAHHLARAGHRVTVLEQGNAASGVTGGSFAWIGLAKSTAEAYSTPMRKEAAREFSRMEDELALPFGLRRGGAITWEASDDETLAFIEGHRALGHQVERLGRAEVLSREPRLRDAPEVAAFAPGDGGVDPVALTRALLQSAIDHGASVHYGTAVASLVTEAGRVLGVETAAGRLLAATVVLATGTRTPALAATAGWSVEVTPSPSCLLRFSTQFPLVNGILSTQDFEIRQLDDRTLIAAEDVSADSYGGDPRSLATHTLDAIRRLIDGGDQVELIDAVVSDRPVPSSGQPLLGFAPGVPGLYVAAAHPAIILAGAIGARVARDFAAPAYL